MSNNKLSIIIPVYNVEKYVERCTRSLMEQTLDDIEFVFVDDCTQDNSINILVNVLDDYPNRKNNVKIIRNDCNLGLSLSRKIGYQASSGNYVCFCDSDDWVDKDMYRTLLLAVQQNGVEVACCRYFKEYSNNIQYSKLYYNGKYRATDIIQDTNFLSSINIWSKIFRRDVLEKAISKVHPCNYGEDLYLILYVYFFAKKVLFIDAVLYHYNLSNVSSLMHKKQRTREEWNTQVVNINRISNLYYSLPNGYKLYHVVINRIKFNVKCMFCHYFMNTKEQYETYKECYRDILRFKDIDFSVRIKLSILYYNFWNFKMLTKFI